MKNKLINYLKIINKTLKTIFDKIYLLLKIIFKILFKSGIVIEQKISNSTIIVMAPKNEDSEVLGFFKNKNALNKAAHPYITQKQNVKVKKNKISIKVNPIKK